ncbi:hypothetical protein Gohar_024835, partial [Gossypium harknessii]|nr:hypothetical protein [Gossypium harknessii]
EIFGDFYSLPSSPFTHSLLEEPQFTLTNFSPQKHSNGSHFLLPSTPAFLPFIQGQLITQVGGIKVAWDERESNNQSAWEWAEWALASSVCEKEVKFQTWSEIETLCKEVEP